MKNLIILSFAFILLFSCKNTGEITSSQAENMVEDYLETNPLYETGFFSTHQMKLKSNKDSEQIEQIQQLESEGLIEIVDEKSRKKWFSKDSVFVITPTLTQKALPYVVEQGKNRTEVKTVEYKLNDKQEVNFNRKDKKVATFNVILLKEKTPFYNFGKDQNPNSDFITKKFKAKYSEENGWGLVD